MPAGWSPYLTAIPHALFSLCFPDECRVCGSALRGWTRAPVCAECLREPAPLAADYFCVQCKTPFLNPFPLDEEGRCALCRAGARGFAEAYCFGSFEGRLRRLIHLLKYEGLRPLAKPLGAWLRRALPLDRRFDVVVPMPLHWRRRLARGFNQSYLLAREVAKARRIPCRQAVRRRKATRTQTGLTPAQRRENVRGAFVVNRPRDIANRTVLLVDDVMTTGATAGACGAALLRAGARSVTLLTLARVDRRLRAADSAAVGSLLA